MDEFATLSESIRRVFPASRFEPATEERLRSIRRDYPGVPGHYLEFLTRIGWGSLGNGDFMVYSGLCEPREFFDSTTATELDGVLFIGDNLAGWMVGFDTRQGWRLVGVDSGSSQPKPYPVEQNSVVAYIAQRIADREDAS